jgi:hypothetical protein
MPRRKGLSSLSVMRDIVQHQVTGDDMGTARNREPEEEGQEAWPTAAHA